jgi:hypothetical protein
MSYPAPSGQSVGVAAFRVADEILGHACNSLAVTTGIRRTMSAACPVFGFAVRVRPARGTVAEQILDALRTMVLEPLGLVASPGQGSSDRIITGDGCQATDADRNVVIAWLEAEATVEGFNVSVLGDVGQAA